MRTRTTFGIVAFLMAGSLALNAALYRQARAWYCDGLEVRLDPTRAAVFASANADLPDISPEVVRVVFVGDSRVEQWEPLPAPEAAQAVNRGSGGEASAQVALRLDRDVLGLHPDVAVVQVGINDLKAVGVLPGQEECAILTCENNLRAIVDRLRAAEIPVVLLTIFPVGPVEWTRRPVWSSATLNALARVNRTIRSLEGPGVTVFDCDAVFAVDGRMNAAYARDAFHLKPAGYRALNEKLGPVIAATVNEARRATANRAAR